MAAYSFSGTQAPSVSFIHRSNSGAFHFWDEYFAGGRKHEEEYAPSFKETSQKSPGTLCFPLLGQHFIGDVGDHSHSYLLGPHCEDQMN